MSNKNTEKDVQNFKINLNNNKKIISIVAVISLIIIVTTTVVSYNLRKNAREGDYSIPFSIYNYYTDGNKKDLYETNADINMQIKIYKAPYKLGSVTQTVSSDYKHVVLKYYITAKNDIEINRDTAFVVKNSKNEEILPSRKLTEPFDVEKTPLHKDNVCQITYVFEVPINKKPDAEYLLFVNMKIGKDIYLNQEMPNIGYFKIKIKG